jgi:hypothetical protein
VKSGHADHAKIYLDSLARDLRGFIKEATVVDPRRTGSKRVAE